MASFCGLHWLTPKPLTFMDAARILGVAPQRSAVFGPIRAASSALDTVIGGHDDAVTLVDVHRTTVEVDPESKQGRCRGQSGIWSSAAP